ncbi:MAG TPA: glycosyltransferase family A protein [Dehalococcoidia bacterium]|nr:glycosyltransferase family A protein [Dehalococcoidia bacterium]
MIDIVIAACDRLPLLVRTLESIWERTRTPYRLHVIDDASRDGTARYLGRLGRERLANAVVRRKRLGIAANLRALAALTTSDPVIYSDDDLLCPNLEPDWLARELAAMATRPRLGILALNNPHCNIGDKRHRLGVDGEVRYCERSPGGFQAIRRAVLAAAMPPDGVLSPVSEMAARAAQHGWQVGYLSEVYCQHIGAMSMRNGRDLSRALALVAPLDADTLEPPVEYRG